MTDFHAREREELHELQARVVLTMPQRGWSRESYERELALHAERHGRAAQTVTMHPDTAVTLGTTANGERLLGHEETLLITSPDYAPERITLYY
jgi:hypothetical protein